MYYTTSWLTVRLTIGAEAYDAAYTVVIVNRQGGGSIFIFVWSNCTCTTQYSHAVLTTFAETGHVPPDPVLTTRRGTHVLQRKASQHQGWPGAVRRGQARVLSLPDPDGYALDLVPSSLTVSILGEFRIERFCFEKRNTVRRLGPADFIGDCLGTVIW